jgi:hypothetical protein
VALLRRVRWSDCSSVQPKGELDSSTWGVYLLQDGQHTSVTERVNCVSRHQTAFLHIRPNVAEIYPTCGCGDTHSTFCATVVENNGNDMLLAPRPRHDVFLIFGPDFVSVVVVEEGTTCLWLVKDEKRRRVSYEI